MADFIFNALPYVVIGICLAIIFANRHRMKEKNQMPIGMCFGMSIGLAVGSSIGHIGLGMSVGMMIGLTVGMFIKTGNKD